jgi:hypothetical protein
VATVVHRRGRRQRNRLHKVFSPLTAASATFALRAGVWFRRARLLIVSPDSRVDLARRQAETPLIALFSFAEPALSANKGGMPLLVTRCNMPKLAIALKMAK